MRILVTENQLLRLIEESKPGPLQYLGKKLASAAKDALGMTPKVTDLRDLRFKYLKLKDAIGRFKYEYIKKNSSNKYDELVSKYKLGLISSDDFIKTLEIGTRINFIKPVTKVYSYKGVKFSEKEHDDIIKILDQIDYRVNNGGINTNEAQVLGSLEIKTTRGNESDIIGYNDQWVDNVAKQYNWDQISIDAWKSAGGFAPDGTSNIYINLQKIYYTKPDLRFIFFHEFAHMKDPAMIPSVSPKYRKNYVPKDFPLTKKYEFHQAELVANRASLVNSIVDITNTWLKNKVPKQTIILKLQELVKLLRQGKIDKESVGKVIGNNEAEGYISDKLHIFFSKKKEFPKEVNKTITDLVVQIDRIILQLNNQRLKESVHSSESIMVTHFR
jgi:hypothetical protein